MWWWLAFPACFLLVLFIFIHAYEKWVSWSLKLPCLSIPECLFNILWSKKTLREIAVQEMQQKGDIFISWFAFSPVVNITSGTLAKQISNKWEIFEKVDPNKLGMSFYMKWVGNDNVVLANGEKWKQIHHKISPWIQNPEKYLSVFVEKAKLLCDRMQSTCFLSSVSSSTSPIDVSKKKQDPVTIHPLVWMQAVTLDIMGKTLFDYEFNALDKTDTLVHAVQTLIEEIFHPLRIGCPWYNSLPLKSNQKLNTCISLLDQLLFKIMNHHRSNENDKKQTSSTKTDNNNSNSNNNKPRDLLSSLLLSWSEKELSLMTLRNNIITLIVAGYETSQVALCGALYYLAKYPSYQEKFARLTLLEVQSDKELDSFLKETMRLYSPLTNQNLRIVKDTVKLDAHTLPAGTLVNIGIHAIHMNPLEWKNPDEFCPDRFMSKEKKGGFLPFGLGARQCAGKRFALMEQKIILWYLLQQFFFSLPFPNYKIPLKKMSFTGIPKSDFILKMELKKKVKSFPLIYPSIWFSPIKLSPFALTIEEDTLRWLKGLGFDSLKMEHYIREMEPRHYAGYTHSWSTYPLARIYCMFITGWLIWDDQIVEKATDLSQVLFPLHALKQEEKKEYCEDVTDVYVKMFADIGHEYRRLGCSQKWLDRFSQSMIEWATFALQEEKVRREQKSKFKKEDQKNSLQQSIDLRKVTVGVRPNSITIEASIGIELPEQILTHPAYLRLIDHAAIICCIVNDLVGVGKDQKKQQTDSNLVCIYQNLYKCALTKAFEEIISIHDASIHAFDVCAQSLLKDCPLNYREQLDAFCRVLRYMDTGFGYWHENCVRYQNHHVMEGDVQLKVVMNK